jgi:hypothetical protein
MPLAEYKLIMDLLEVGWPVILDSLISINCGCLSIG